MDRATLEALYASSSVPRDELQEILDKVEEFRMTGMFNRVMHATQEERDNYLQSQVRANIQRQEQRRQQLEERQIKKGKSKIDDHIKKEMLDHIEAIRRASNIEITSEKDYETACLLKAFAIEYMLKIINIMSNTSPEKEKQFAQGNADASQLIGELMKQTRDQLATNNPGRRFTGHEINDLLNTLLPDQIKTLIKYKAITNYVDPTVRDNGEFVSMATQTSSMENFIADYFLLIKDFTQDGTPLTQSKMGEASAKHNQNYLENNKAFEVYRYRDKQAGLCDYNMLNSLMASTQMVLTFLLENRDLARDIQANEAIPYEAVSTTLTREEYENLLQLSSREAYDTNGLIYYHSFLKQYLQDRTPRLTDERYARINSLFTEIKNSGDISLTGETFAEWFKNIKMDSLTPEELKELKVIAPEFIYNSLSYSDKLIFKKCQERGIEFEYYYKMEPEKFDKIVSVYGHHFQGTSIDIKLLKKSLEEIPPLLDALKSVHTTPAMVPSYYYDYSPETIKLAHFYKPKYTPEELNELGITDVPICVSKDELTSAHVQLMAENLMSEEDLDMNSQDTYTINETIQRIYSSLYGLYEITKRKDADTMAKFLELEAGIKSGTITEENCLANGYNAKDFHKAKMMQILAEKYKTETIEPFIDMSAKELNNKAHSITWYLPSISSFLLERHTSLRPSHTNEFPFLVLKNCPQVEKMMDKGIEVRPEMKFLRAQEVSTSYTYIQTENPEVEIGDYLLYKTPDDVKEIIQICHQMNVEFQPEFLYYDMDIIKNDLYRVEDSIDDVKATLQDGESFTYENAKNIMDRMRARKLQRQRTNISDQASQQTTSSNELNEMLSSQLDQIIVISPNLLTVNKQKSH